MSKTSTLFALLLSVLACAPADRAAGDDGVPGELRVKREAVYAFARPPAIQRDGNTWTITFETTAWCDVTVAVERADGTILRHLACGVLGDNAPAPLARGTKRQSLTWDGKDDAGRYVDDLSDVRARVSLGLRARFERTLFWSPKRRQSRMPPLAAATEEGVYLYDGGNGIDHLRLFSHDGDYVRTVYPFPADKVEQAKGLGWHRFIQDGRRLPVKTNFLQCTLLTSGPNAWGNMTWQPGNDRYKSGGIPGEAHWGMYDGAGAAMDVRAGRIALTHHLLNRLGTDGTTAGLELTGPQVYQVAPVHRHKDQPAANVPPRSIALGPKGRWLYLSCLPYGRRGHASQDIEWVRDWRGIPAVLRLDMQSNDPPTLFKGSTDPKKVGNDNEHFKVPGGVAVDGQGRVYVADHLNDRVQVFDAEGRHLKAIKTPRPADVQIHPRTGEVFVFSWKIMNEFEQDGVHPRITRFGPFDDPKKRDAWDLGGGPLGGQWSQRYRSTGVELFAELDGWVDPPVVWLSQEDQMSNVLTERHAHQSSVDLVRLEGGGKMTRVRDFNKDVAGRKIPLGVHKKHRQRLYVNPTDGMLYLAEGDNVAVGKSFDRMHRIDPATGNVRLVHLPFHAEDMCFGPDGLAYLRTINVVVRYDPTTWREVPWDYGEQRDKVAYGWMSGTKRANVVAGLMIPADGNWHHGGMHVSPKGHLAVACLLNYSLEVRTADKYVHRGEKYKPPVFPGRLLGGRGGATVVHVWDKHGRLVREDAVPGLADLYGVAVDRDDNIYVMSAATRIYDGKPYYNDMTGTVMRFGPNKGRVLTASDRIPVKLSEANYPKRDADIVSAMQGRAWVEGADWLYGGVGFGGKNVGNGCACWNFRFAHDTFARTFAPEMDRYSVAVLDRAGNLVMRIGTYGNVDDGKPLVADGGPDKPRSIGGDEVALFHAPYLATHTDRRLFVADPGNGRILSVKLDYHAAETVAIEAPGGQ